jgi:hypothetical protein
MKIKKNSEPKNRKKIRRKKEDSSPSLVYFDEQTQQSIVVYKEELDPEKKKVIYTKEILPAFDSLVENLINVYGFNVIYESKNDLKNECLGFLYTAVSKFNPEKGSKAFSYFNVVAKNWLTIKSKQNNKKVQNYISLDNTEALSKDDAETIENYSIVPSFEELMVSKENHALFASLLEEVEKKAKTENERKCIRAIKTLSGEIDKIDLLSKRAILIYIREMTNLSSKQLSMVLSNLKKHYQEIRRLEAFEY